MCFCPKGQIHYSAVVSVCKWLLGKIFLLSDKNYSLYDTRVI
nr:MAG TPA: hypothetical protein [Caudoviricetes sp.]